MTFKQRQDLYNSDSELDKLLMNSFEPYVSLVKENKEAEKDCAEHFGVSVDSAEFAIITRRPF